MFSKACEYGIRAVVYIWTQSKKGNKVGVKEICKDIDTPEYFTGKILQSLARQGIVSSTKGPNGGFFIDKEQENINLMDLVVSIDGDKLFKGCGLGLKQCSASNPCPLHYEYKEIREGLANLLKDKTLRGLADEVSSGKATLHSIL